MTAVGWAALALGLVLLPAGGAAGARVGARAAAAVPAAAAAAAGCAVVLVAGAVLGLAAAVAAATATRLVVVARADQAVRAERDRLVAAVRLVVAELQAGASPATALAAAAGAGGRLSGAFRDAATRAEQGIEPAFCPPVPPELAGLAHGWRLAARSGASFAVIAERVADGISAEIEQARAVAGALAGARASAALLAGLPALGLLLGAAMQARPLDVLLGTPSGRLLCLVGVGLDAAGVLWTQQLTARAGRGP